MNFTSYIGENLSKQESVAIWNNLPRDMRAAHGITLCNTKQRKEQDGMQRRMT